MVHENLKKDLHRRLGVRSCPDVPVRIDGVALVLNRRLNNQLASDEPSKENLNLLGKGENLGEVYELLLAKIKQLSVYETVSEVEWQLIVPSWSDGIMADVTFVSGEEVSVLILQVVRREGEFKFALLEYGRVPCTEISVSTSVCYEPPTWLRDLFIQARTEDQLLWQKRNKRQTTWAKTRQAINSLFFSLTNAGR